MDEDSEIQRFFTPAVEAHKQKIQPIILPERLCETFLNTERVPENVYEPDDLEETYIVLRNLYNKRVSDINEDYINKNLSQSEQHGVESVFNLLIKCHQTLKLKDSNFYQLSILMHRIL